MELSLVLKRDGRKEIRYRGATRFQPARTGASLVAHWLRIHLPVQGIQETWVQFLGQEDPLEKGMAFHFSVLARKTPQAEEPGRLQSMGSQKLDMIEQLTL